MHGSFAIEVYVHQAVYPLIEIKKDATCEEYHGQVRVDGLLTDECLILSVERKAVDSVQAPRKEHHATY